MLADISMFENATHSNCGSSDVSVFNIKLENGKAILEEDDKAFVREMVEIISDYYNEAPKYCDEDEEVEGFDANNSDTFIIWSAYYDEVAEDEWEEGGFANEDDAIGEIYCKLTDYADTLENEPWCNEYGLSDFNFLFRC